MNTGQLVQKYSENIDHSVFQKRIRENHLYNIDQYCSFENLDHINAIVITVNIERATAEYVNNFRENMKVILNSDNTIFILDFSHTLFMDSTFLGSIVLILKQINAKGAKLSLVINMDKIKILSPFEQLKKILRVNPTLDEAIANIDKT